MALEFNVKLCISSIKEFVVLAVKIVSYVVRARGSAIPI
jgi:hypothetical protein